MRESKAEKKTRPRARVPRNETENQFKDYINENPGYYDPRYDQIVVEEDPEIKIDLDSIIDYPELDQQTQMIGGGPGSKPWVSWFNSESSDNPWVGFKSESILDLPNPQLVEDDPYVKFISLDEILETQYKKLANLPKAKIEIPKDLESPIRYIFENWSEKDEKLNEVPDQTSFKSNQASSHLYPFESSEKVKAKDFAKTDVVRQKENTRVSRIIPDVEPIYFDLSRVTDYKVEIPEPIKLEEIKPLTFEPIKIPDFVVEDVDIPDIIIPDYDDGYLMAIRTSLEESKKTAQSSMIEASRLQEEEVIKASLLTYAQERAKRDVAINTNTRVEEDSEDDFYIDSLSSGEDKEVRINDDNNDAQASANAKLNIYLSQEGRWKSIWRKLNPGEEGFTFTRLNGLYRELQDRLPKGRDIAFYQDVFSFTLIHGHRETMVNYFA